MRQQYANKVNVKFFLVCFFCSLWRVQDTSLWEEKVETTGITLKDMLLWITKISPFPTFMPKDLLGAQDSIGLTLKHVSAFKQNMHTIIQYYP